MDSRSRPSYSKRRQYSSVTSSTTAADDEAVIVDEELSSPPFAPRVKKALSQLQLLPSSQYTAAIVDDDEDDLKAGHAAPSHPLERSNSSSSSSSSSRLPSRRESRRSSSASPSTEDEDSSEHVADPASPISPDVDTAATTATAASSDSSALLSLSVLQRWMGFIMLAVSALCFSLMSLFVSLTGGRVNSMLLVMWRCAVQFGIAALILLYQRVDIRGPPGVRGWIFARGAVGIASLSCFYYALTHLPLSEATVLFFTAPIWTGVLGKLLLHETFDRWDALCSICSFVGVVLVARPPVIFGENADDHAVVESTAERNFAIFIALLGAFISAFVYLAIRRVGKGTNPLVLVACLGWIGLLVCPFDLLLESWALPSSVDWAFMVCIGVFAFAGQLLFNAGVQKEKAGISSLIRNLDIVFSVVWQLTVEGQAINPFSLLGACIVTGSVIALGLRKSLRHHQQLQQQAQLSTATGEDAQRENVKVDIEVVKRLQLAGEEQEVEDELVDDDEVVELEDDAEAEEQQEEAQQRKGSVEPETRPTAPTAVEMQQGEPAHIVDT